MYLQIQKARRKDLPIVLRLLAAMDGEEPLPLARATAIHREMSRYPSYSCYLALADGVAIGTFSLLVFPTLVHDGRLEALVDGVVVDPAFRGRGIGGAMMAEAMRLAAQAGCHKLGLSSNAKREDAHRFYRSLGFRQHGVSFWIDIAPLGNAEQSVRELLSAAH